MGLFPFSESFGVLFLVFLLLFPPTVSGIGANWGTQATHRLPPEIVVRMLKDNGIQKVKLFDADYDTLKALGKSGLEVMVGIPNDMLSTMGSLKAAEKWVSKNVSVHISDNSVNIRYVAVGNEPYLQTYNGTYLRTTLPAMQNIQTALVKAGLGNQVKVTCPLNADVYESSSSLPSGGDFRADIHGYVSQLVKFLSDNGCPFTINIYPFISLYIDPNFPVEYAFFDGNATPLNDGGTIYTNMFDANHDTLVWALQKNGFGNVPIIIGEIGWPTDGDRNANARLAQRFNQGFMQHISAGKGTPMRPGPVDAYLFSLIDEDAKSIQPGNFERHWGIFTYDGLPKYTLNLGTTNSGSLVQARNVKYLDRKWCVLKPNAKIDDPQIAPSMSYACGRADCTSLGYQTSCGGLDARGNISYAFNSYYQINNQLDDACKFSGLGTVTKSDPSTGTCRFGLMIQPYYGGAPRKHKSNASSIALHKAAFALFASLENQLSLLKQQFTSNQPLIVTGHSLGGSVASLFTLWLLDNLPINGVQHTVCITFGSPLLGNNGFQKAISEHPTWRSCFLHVVSDKDPVPRFLISDHNASDATLTTPAYYMPFGTYLFGSESGFSCFEEPQSILELLMIMNSRCAESENLNNCSQVIDYGHIMEQLKSKTICRGTSELPDSISNPLQAGTYLLLEATGVGKLQENVNLSYLAMNIAKRAEVQAKHKQKDFDPSKISITKKSLSYLEWYMKNSLEEAGYYDKYKTRRSRSRDEIESTENLIKHHRTLKLFWKKTVSEVENLPWKERRIRRKRLLYAVTNYRRIVEPLDIAEYYGRGKKDYVNHGRSEHYKVMEKWLAGEDMFFTYQRSQAPSLAVDSCFWAYVEEALISCEVLKDGQGSSPQDQESARENLIKFEQYVMDMINNFLVSPEIFLSQSSFMLWWREYSRAVGNSYTSPLTNFMNDGFRRYA